MSNSDSNRRAAAKSTGIMSKSVWMEGRRSKFFERGLQSGSRLHSPILLHTHNI